MVLNKLSIHGCWYILSTIEFIFKYLGIFKETVIGKIVAHTWMLVVMWYVKNLYLKNK